jgi:hypothetical protein
MAGGGALTRSERTLERRLSEADALWPPQLAVAVAIALNLAVASKITPGPNWLLPASEAVLLGVLVATTERRARKATEGRRRRIALVTVGFVTVVNAALTIRLVDYLLDGGNAGGRPLIGSGIVLLATSVLLFAVWYWELDAGGPAERSSSDDTLQDFHFPQMDIQTFVARNWRPGFGDYLYMSLTNATAFSPTDTMPVTHRAKAIMAFQSVTALGTILLIVARAVNILA